MIDFWTVFSAVMPVYCLVAVGVFLRKADWLTHQADESLIRVVVNVLTPCLILDNVLNNEALRRADNLLLPPLFGFCGIVVGVGVGWMVRRWVGASNVREERTFACATGFQNYGYAALPLVIKLFPRETTGVLFLHNLGVDIAMWTVGLVTLGHAGLTDWRKLVNAPLVAIVAGVVLNLGGIRLPEFLHTSNHMLGACCFPLGLILIGATLAETTGQLRSGGGWRLMLSGCVVRCGITPILLLLGARYLPASVELKQVLLIEAAMPAAVFPIVLARHYGGDTLTAVRVVVATSAIGFVTIPMWVRFGLGFVLGKR
jgi:malate permease and related proteins